MQEIQPGGRWRDLLRILRELRVFANALLKLQIKTNTGRNAFNITQGNAILEINAAPASAVVDATPTFFRLVKVDDTHIRVMVSTLVGVEPDGFNEGDTPNFVLTVSGSGYVLARVTVNADGAILAIGAGGRNIIASATIPDDTGLVFHVEIGSYSTDSGVLTVAQTRYGPIGGIIVGGFNSNFELVEFST